MSTETRLLFAFGLALWLLSSLACVWEILALQPPDSPLHLGVLTSPIVQLRNYAFALGTASLVLAVSFRRLYEPGEGRLALVLLGTGATLHVATLLYAAATGLLAVQAFDPRADARYALYLRALGHALTTAAALLLLLRVARLPSRTAPKVATDPMPGPSAETTQARVPASIADD